MTKPVSRLAVVGVSFVLFVAGGSLRAADDADDATADPEHRFVEYLEVNVSELPQSNTIATKLPMDLLHTPANVGIVPKALFLEQNALDLGDALRNVSGVNVSSGPAVHDFFTLRGFDSLSSGLVLTDGAVEPEATFYRLYNIEGVEVLKGPGGFLYGTNPLAGVVNMVRKQPLPGRFGAVGGTYGSYGTFEGTVDWNLATADDAQRFRVNGLWSGSDGFRDGKDSSHVAVNPSYSVQVGERGQVNVDYEYVDVEHRPDSGIPVYAPDPIGAPNRLVLPDVSRRTSYQTPFDFSEQQIHRFQVNVESKLSERVTLRNKLYYRSMKWDSSGTLLQAADVGFGPTVFRTLTLLEDDQEFIGNQFESVLSFDRGGVSHDLLFGFEVARYADEFRIGVIPPAGFTPGIPNVDLFNPVETLGPLPAPFPLPGGTGDARSVIFAPYVIDKIEFSDRWQLLVGARHDTIDVKDDFDGQRRDDREASPMIGLTFSPQTTLSLYANAGRSHSPASLRVEGDLDPERSTQVELGAKKRFADGRVQTSVAFYRIERDNIAITDSNGVTQQSGDQESTGFEFELAAEPAARLRTFFSYAYNDAELTRFTRIENGGFGPFVDLSGNRPPYAPEHLANLWISRDLRNGLGVAGGARYVSEQFFNADNAFEVDGYVLFDAAVFYDLETWRLKLNFKNLTDEDYETGSFASSSVVPGDPFTVYGSFEYRF